MTKIDNKIKQFEKKQKYCKGCNLGSLGFYKLLLCGIIVIVLGVMSFAEIVIVKDKKAMGTIFVPENAIASEKKAASELQRYIKRITGAKLDIVNTENADNLIKVGQNSKLKNIKFSQLKSDEIVIKTQDDCLYISGGRPRGTLYAAYEFIEQNLGIRFLSAKETFVPYADSIVIGNLDVRYAPQFITRDIFQSNMMPHNGDLKMLSKCRSNGCWGGIKEEDGFGNKILGGCHTFYFFLPPGKYFKTHPEWYSQSSGKRLSKDGQLCLSNKEMQKEFTKNVLDKLRKNPNMKFVSISQNDNGAYCTCPHCKKIDAEEESHAGSMIRFVNYVAENVQKEFPDVIVDTLAYQYTTKAPKITHPRDNVMVRLCTDHCDFSAPVSSPKNAAFVKNVKSWSGISKHLGIWHYIANYSNFSIPHPNIWTWERDFRFFKNNKAIYVLVEGDHGGNEISEMGELRTYLLRNLLWDPSRDQRALTNEFLKLYYKNAAPEVAEYLQLLTDEVKLPGTKMPCQFSDTSPWLRLGTLLKARKILERADKKTRADKALNKKIKRIMFNTDVALLLRGEYSGYNPDRDKFPKINFAAVIKSVDEGRKEWQSYGLGAKWDDAKFKQLKKLVEPPSDTKMIPPFCKGLPLTSWREFQENEFRFRPRKSIIDDPKASNGKTCKYNVPNNWLIQCDLPANKSKKKNYWNVYVAVYCKGKFMNANATAFQAGTHNVSNGLTSSKNGTFKDYVQPDYQWMKLGKFNLKDSIVVWILTKPGVTTYVDRIVIVRAK